MSVSLINDPSSCWLRVALRFLTLFRINVHSYVRLRETGCYYAYYIFYETIIRKCTSSRPIRYAKMKLQCGDA